MRDTGRYDKLLKTVGIIALVLIGLALINSLLSGGRVGMGYQYGMGYGGHDGYQTGIGLDGLIVLILGFALKILWLALIAGLVAGVVIFIRKYLNEQNISFNFLQNAAPVQITCPGCGAKLNKDYRFCPECGTPINTKEGEGTGE